MAEDPLRHAQAILVRARNVVHEQQNETRWLRVYPRKPLIAWRPPVHSGAMATASRTEVGSGEQDPQPHIQPLEKSSMKKTLIALAALAATSAFAQSSVTLYGVADVALTKVTGTSAALGASRGLNNGTSPP